MAWGVLCEAIDTSVPTGYEQPEDRAFSLSFVPCCLMFSMGFHTFVESTHKEDSAAAGQREASAKCRPGALGPLPFTSTQLFQTFLPLTAKS
jgi:hypothetical protein